MVPERGDAVSVALEIPPELSEVFAYRAGQFITFRVLIDGTPHLRSYSMSSAPEVDDELRITVKRVSGGVVSSWIIDVLSAGDQLVATRPAGRFCLPANETPIVGFAAGSGITPVFSLLKSALITSGRPIRLLYANQSRDVAIFADEIDALAARHERLQVTHHLDVESGFVDDEMIRRFIGTASSAEFFVCGPPPFMDIVEVALQAAHLPAERIHIERFAPLDLGDVQAPARDAPTASQVTVELDGRVESSEHRPGTTILQTARQMGLSPPFSCEAGDCATCMARIVEGTAQMRANSALDDDEVQDGWVLTCQAVPTSATVRVVYGYEEH